MTEPVTDTRFGWTDHNGNKAHCRLDILTGANDHPIVVLTELADNPGASVTNAAQALTTAVRRLYMLPDSAIYIEHYGPMSYDFKFDDDIYSRILTEWDANRHNVARDWQYLSHEDMWRLLPENSKFPLYLSEDEYPFALIERHSVTQGARP